MMGRKTILLLIVGVLGAYYVYTPLPDNIEELWKLMWVTTCLKTMTHLLIDDPDVKIKLKTQSLIYPALQSLDLDLPSYRENSNFLGLTKSFVVRLWSGYFTTDRSLEKAMFFNQHVPVESSNLFKFVNWSSLLPEKFKKGHFYNSPTYDSNSFFPVIQGKNKQKQSKTKTDYSLSYKPSLFHLLFLPSSQPK
ncbi:arylacetamide deacetylase-like [Bos indicus]|uniref:Arylacetamide deacetylase-like n=1 Tax=Bos indicus TaxID=9915 RepID=A0ABM4SN53_BOSIN|nr:arylacetamide deacetylase-like [Bos indicus x Bos taurus]